jgi:hypothetical protein
MIAVDFWTWANSPEGLFVIVCVGLILGWLIGMSIGRLR